MIAQVTNEQTERWYRAACAGKPYFGCLLPVQLALFRKASGCYFAGPDLAVDANGAAVIAAGTADPEELAGFLAFLDKHRILTDGPAPAGWRLGRRMWLFTLAAGSALPVPPRPAAARGLVLNEQPSPYAVASLLFAAEPDRRDNFYAELCTKRNHGCARVWTLERDGEILATAGAYAQHDGQAYLACVETVEPLRGQKLGGWLVAQLANALAAGGETVVLLCGENRRTFYRRLGFTEAGCLPEYTDRPPAPETYDNEEPNVTAIL